MGAALAQGVSVVVVGAALGGALAALSGLVPAVGLGLGAVASALPAWRLALEVVRCRPYPEGPLGLALAVLDSTWGAVTTWASAWFLFVLSLRGNTTDPHRSHRTGLLHLCDPAIPGYATTVGMVVAGCSPRLEPHERVHVLQARVFGPLYLPLVGVGFVVATLVPYWLLSLSTRKRVNDLRSYFVRGVYPNTWHEWWAYRVAADS